VEAIRYSVGVGHVCFARENHQAHLRVREHEFGAALRHPLVPEQLR